MQNSTELRGKLFFLIFERLASVRTCRGDECLSQRPFDDVIGTRGVYQGRQTELPDVLDDGRGSTASSLP